MNRPPDVNNFNGLLSSTQDALQCDVDLDENVTQAARELRSLLNVSFSKNIATHKLKINQVWPLGRCLQGRFKNIGRKFWRTL